MDLSGFEGSKLFANLPDLPSIVRRMRRMIFNFIFSSALWATAFFECVFPWAVAKRLQLFRRVFSFMVDTTAHIKEHASVLASQGTSWSSVIHNVGIYTAAGLHSLGMVQSTYFPLLFLLNTQKLIEYSKQSLIEFFFAFSHKFYSRQFNFFKL